MAKKNVKKAPTPGPLRAGAKWLVRNNRKGTPEPVRGSGLALYDEGHRAAIEQSSLGILGLDIFRSTDDLKQLAKSEQVWLFTLGLQESDGPFVAQWWVGAPPSPDELPKRPANKPLKKRLSLPGGKVHVEGSEAFSFGPDAESDAGIVIHIPPGVYDVALHQAPDLENDIARRYFFLSFNFVSDLPVSKLAKPKSPAKASTNPRSESNVDVKEQERQLNLGKKHGFAGKDKQSTNPYYKRGWSIGKKDREHYEKGLAHGLAGKPCHNKIQLGYKRGWRDGNRARMERAKGDQT